MKLVKQHCFGRVGFSCVRRLQIFAVQMSTRSFAFRTRRHTTAHAPASTIGKSTRRLRRLLERWPERRVADLRQHAARSSHASYHERKATLALLAVSNRDEYERVTTEYRRQRNAQQQARRQRNKLALRLQAVKLLKHLEAELASSGATSNGNNNKKKKEIVWRRVRGAARRIGCVVDVVGCC
jgi:hypothetical protein